MLGTPDRMRACLFLRAEGADGVVSDLADLPGPP